MLPQNLVCKYGLNYEYCNVTLARNTAPWWWYDKSETCRSVLKVFYVKLYVRSLVDKLKRFYENERCYNKIYKSEFLLCTDFSSARIVLRAGTFGVRTPVRGGGRDFSAASIDRTWVPSSLLWNGHRVLFPGAYRPERGVDFLPPLSVTLQTVYSYTASPSVRWPLPSHVLIKWYILNTTTNTRVNRDNVLVSTDILTTEASHS